nr:hypothetical protein [uncultured Prevotella sp.]
MRKLTKASLSELAKSKEIISFLEQKSYVGGGTGESGGLYSYEEFIRQMESNQWQGGYVDGVIEVNNRLTYNGGTHATYISSDFLKYAGGSHFRGYFDNSVNPYSGGTEYQGGSNQFQTPEKKEKVKYDPNDCFWQTIAYIQYGDEGRGNDKLAREIAKEVLGENFKEGNYACKMSFNDMQRVMVDYFKTHERKKDGVVQVLISTEASDFYDGKRIRYDESVGHAAVIDSYDMKKQVYTLTETQNEKTIYANSSDLQDGNARIITIK